MGVLHSFVRRLLVQAVVSGTVMAGLQVAVRFGPEVFPPALRTATLTEPTVPPAETTRATTPAAPSPSPFAQDRTHADVKAGRLPVWRDREATATAIPTRRLASGHAGTGLSDVMLFDKCRPGCESRDPLLAFNRQSAATAYPQVAPASALEVLDDLAVSSVPGEADADGDVVTAEGGGIVAAATRGTLSVARGIVDTAGSVVGW